MSKGFSTPKPSVRLSLEHLLIAGIAIAILLRILNLGSREFWYDEVLSLILSNGQKAAYKTPGSSPVVLADYTALLSLPAESAIRGVIATITNLLKGLVGAEPHPPLFFLSQHFWLRLFGNSEAAMRSLGVLLSIGSIGGIYGLGRTLLGHRGGLVVAALLAANPFYVFHSLNLRMYGALVLWTILSAWATLQLIHAKSEERGVGEWESGGAGERESGGVGEWESGRGGERESGRAGERESGRITNHPLPDSARNTMLWTVVLIGSVAAGLLTFYLFAYWIVTLAVLVLFLDRQRWWQYGWRVSIGVLLTLPWAVWGTRQQLRNADIERFSASASAVESGIRHLQDVAQALGTQLVLGDWVTSLPPAAPIVAGVVAIALLTACTIDLWRRGNRRLLGIAFILGIFPLLLALVVDIVTSKFTLGFGWGRATIFIVPGCLLLIAVWLEKVAGRWRELVACVLLLFYLSVSIGDFSLRQRWMFHQVADVIRQQPTTPTLVAMNSRAWGHCLRLAYYIPPASPVTLLAQNPADLSATLEKFLQSANAQRYSRLIWLDFADPVWSRLKSTAEVETESKRIQKVLNSKFKLNQQQPLSGTMDLDQFTVNVYTRSTAK